MNHVKLGRRRSLRTGAYTTEHGNLINDMDVEYNCGLMEATIRESGMLMQRMVKVG